MSVESSRKKSVLLTGWKHSHRTLSEQALGGAIFFLISFAAEWLSTWLIQSSSTEWAKRLFSAHWSFSTIVSQPAWALYHSCIAFSMWILWRRYSLKTLKLELSIFLVQLFFQVNWSFCFFVFRESRIALATLIFLCSTTFLGTLLYWKKERLSGQILIPPFLWTFYVMAVNMAICISNP